MNGQILTFALISLLMGILVGMIVVLIIQLWRKKILSDSLVRSSQLIGKTATVEIPFDENSKGKIRLNIKDCVLELTACTDYSDKLQLGQTVLIIQVKDNNVWVVPHDINHESEESLS